MIYNNDRDPNIINWEDENWGDRDKLIRQEVEDMLKDVVATDGDYKTGYKQAILNVLSLLDYYNKK